MMNTPATPFEWIGGEPAVRALVDRFYDLMDLEPGYRELRASHGAARIRAFTASAVSKCPSAAWRSPRTPASMPRYRAAAP